MIINVCKTCDLPFTKKNNPNRLYIYCSFACKRGTFANNRQHATCDQCAIGFSVWPHEAKGTRRFCSKGCADKSRDQGKTTEAFRLRTSAKYAEWRRKVFERDDYTCQICDARGGRLNADHIKRFADYPDLRLSVDNGRTLCVACHLKTDTFGNRRRPVVAAEA